MHTFATAALWAFAVYSAVAVLMGLAANHGYRILVKAGDRQTAEKFRRLIVPAIRHWPLLVFITMPHMALARRR